MKMIRKSVIGVGLLGSVTLIGATALLSSAPGLIALWASPVVLVPGMLSPQARATAHATWQDSAEVAYCASSWSRVKAVDGDYITILNRLDPPLTVHTTESGLQFTCPQASIPVHSHDARGSTEGFSCFPSKQDITEFRRSGDPFWAIQCGPDEVVFFR
jgi:hypothetical protein